MCIGCSSVYTSLKKSDGNATVVGKFQPVFNSVLYTADVDVIDKHLSGLLLIKTMPDSSIRTVFTSEMGLKYFDFGFSKQDGFKVYYVIKQMDRNAVITTLQKDFEMMLMQNLDYKKAVVMSDTLYNYVKFPTGKENIYYILNSSNEKLIRVERANKRKPKVQLLMSEYQQNVPDSISFTHTNFHFVITLNRIKH